MIAGVGITGIPALQQVLTQLGETAINDLAAAMYRQGEYVMTDSKRQVPVDTGNLKSTGHVSLPEVNGTVATVTLGYGGTAGEVTSVSRTGARTELLPTGDVRVRTATTTFRTLDTDVGYAVIVHETPPDRAHHPVGKWKYLEDPLLDRAGKMETEIAKDLQRTLLDRGRSARAQGRKTDLNEGLGGTE
jgi:hypothetical protein